MSFILVANYVKVGCAMSKEKDSSNIKQENLSASDNRNKSDLSEYTAVMLMFIAITSCGLITGAETNQGVNAMFGAAIAGIFFSEWRSSRKRTDLLIWAMSGLGALIALASAIINMLDGAA